MVALVVVSHSAVIARGVVELARQMAGPEVVIEAVGGTLVTDDRGAEVEEIGTDAVAIMEAIERADSADGVVVLMDLGSAVLSTEMALEMLDEGTAGRVSLCPAPLVEGAVGAATAARLGLERAEVAAEARRGLAAKLE
ncbi:MAG: dihydroxyacetone kinase phosphoryl donor subunit DhaM, partial [Actinomycetota bacterium]